MATLRSIRTRLIAVIVAMVIAVCGVLAIFSMSQQSRQTDLALDREMRSEYQSVLAAIDFERKSLLSLATMMAANPDIQSAFAARDRNRLLAQLKGTLDALKSAFGYDVLQFTVPPAINFFRVHNPTQFDDDVSARRKMIVAAHQTGQPQSGIEPSTSSLAVFAMAPVMVDGKRIGFAENGFNLGKPFVDSIKQRFGIDVAFHLYDGKSFDTIISTLPDKTTVSAAEYSAAFAGTPMLRRSELGGKAVAAYVGQIRNFSGQPVAVVEIVKNIDDFATLADHSRTILMLVALGVVAAAVTIALFLGIGLSRPIVRITATMTALSGGNTGVEVSGTERQDEIGRMAAAVQVFKDKMLEGDKLRAEQEELKARAETEKKQALGALADRFESSVKTVVQNVSTAADKLQANAQSMSATAEETSRQSAAVAAASAHASDNVQTVSAATEELSSSVSEIGRQVSESAQIAGAAVREADQTNTQVQALSEAAQRIGEVVSLINDIAGQTNLLALNATIEAARAGEAGKGFAVVASEVKNLATQTAKATGDIADQVKGIQSATADSVHAIGGIGQTIGRINQIATAIASAVQQQGAATQEIARNVQEASRGTTQVSANISGVTAAAAGTGKASEAVLAAAGDLSKEADTLRKEVASFLASIRAA